MEKVKNNTVIHSVNRQNDSHSLWHFQSFSLRNRKHFVVIYVSLMVSTGKTSHLDDPKAYCLDQKLILLFMSVFCLDD